MLRASLVLRSTIKPKMSTTTDIYKAVAAEGQSNAAGLSSSAVDRLDALFASARTTGSPAGTARTFYGVEGVGAGAVVALGVGAKPTGQGESVENKLKEQSRRAAALGLLALKTTAASTSVLIDPLHSAHAAAVGAHLASWVWTLKTDAKSRASLAPVAINLLGPDTASALASEQGIGGGVGLSWDTGVIYAKAQNLARELMELPANLMTPTLFCARAEKELKGVANVEVIVRDLAWAESKKMGAFISVSKGSDQPLKFLEAHYRGAIDKTSAPLAFVGKGITFDCGGINVKLGADMPDMRGDMVGYVIS